MPLQPPPNLFKNFKTAKPMLDSDYIKPGHYWTVIDRVKYGQNRASVDFIAIEMTVLRVLDNAGGLSSCVHGATTRLISKAQIDYFDREYRTFLSKVMEVPFEDITEEDATMVLGDDQPLSGLVVEVKGVSVKTKKEKDFTRCMFVRTVPASEVLGTLDPEIVKRYFPNGRLEAQAKAEAK